MGEATRARAEELDAADPLARFKNRFVVDDPELTYLDGNSLGRLLHSTRARLQRVIDHEWGEDLIRSWDHWVDLPTQVGERIGRIVGARPGDVVVADSTTVNFYKLAVAALDARPNRSVILTDVDNFPTDRYVLEGLASSRGAEICWVEADPVEGPQAADIEAALDDDVALVTLSHVGYRSGAVADLPAITRLAHDFGALTLWDLSHSAGSVEVGLDEHDADLAVGCTYKYLNGGPGAPAFLYVRDAIRREVMQPIWGWMGQHDLFEMGPRYEPESDIRAFLAGSPNVLGLSAVDEGAAIIEEATLPALVEKGSALTSFAIELHDERLAPLGFSVGTPRDPRKRGSHVAFRHRDARDLCAALIKRKVIPDFRTPDSIRLGLAPLTTSFVDVWTAIDVLVTVAGGGTA